VTRALPGDSPPHRLQFLLRPHPPLASEQLLVSLPRARSRRLRLLLHDQIA
jgi:hypothetical protein